MVNGLNEFRNSLITDFHSTEEIDVLFLNIIDAQETKKETRYP